MSLILGGLERACDRTAYNDHVIQLDEMAFLVAPVS